MSLIAIDLGDICYQSLPCAHEITEIYSDGSRKDVGMKIGYDIIAQYHHVMSPQDKHHFDYQVTIMVKPNLWRRFLNMIRCRKTHDFKNISLLDYRDV